MHHDQLLLQTNCQSSSILRAPYCVLYSIRTLPVPISYIQYTNSIGRLNHILSIAIHSCCRCMQILINVTPWQDGQDIYCLLYSNFRIRQQETFLIQVQKRGRSILTESREDLKLRYPGRQLFTDTFLPYDTFSFANSYGIY